MVGPAQQEHATAGELTVGSVYRYPKPTQSDDALIDGLPNWFWVTKDDDRPALTLEKGITRRLLWRGTSRSVETLWRHFGTDVTNVTSWESPILCENLLYLGFRWCAVRVSNPGPAD